MVLHPKSRAHILTVLIFLNGKLCTYLYLTGRSYSSTEQDVQRTYDTSMHVRTYISSHRLTTVRTVCTFLLYPLLGGPNDRKKKPKSCRNNVDRKRGPFFAGYLSSSTTEDEVLNSSIGRCVLHQNFSLLVRL